MGRIFGCFIKCLEKKKFSTFAQTMLLHECLLKLNTLLRSKHKVFKWGNRVLFTEIQTDLGLTDVVVSCCPTSLSACYELHQGEWPNSINAHAQ